VIVGEMSRLNADDVLIVKHRVDCHRKPNAGGMGVDGGSTISEKGTQLLLEVGLENKAAPYFATPIHDKAAGVSIGSIVGSVSRRFAAEICRLL